MRLAELFLAGLLGLGSCYRPPRDLGLPDNYAKPNSPYVEVRDEKNDITYFTLRHTRHLIDDIKDRVPELMKAVEESEGIKRNITLKVVTLNEKDYRRLERNSNLREKSRGLCDISDICMALKNYHPGFTNREQQTNIHETYHIVDLLDGRIDWSEEEVIKKVKELSKKLGLD